MRCVGLTPAVKPSYLAHMSRTAVAALLLAFVAHPAWSLTLCKTKRGQLLVRDACKKKETSLALSEIGGERGPTGPQGPIGPEGPRGRRGPGLSVRDSENTLVGGVVGTLANGSVLFVAREADTEMARLAMTADGFVEIDTDAPIVSQPTGPRGPLVFSYTQAGCAGNALLAYDDDFVVSAGGNGPLLRNGFVRGTTAYFPTGPVTVQNVQSQKVVTTDSAACTDAGGAFTPPDACCVPKTPFDAPAASAGMLDLAPLAFVPPFHTDVQ